MMHILQWASHCMVVTCAIRREQWKIMSWSYKTLIRILSVPISNYFPNLSLKVWPILPSVDDGNDRRVLTLWDNMRHIRSIFRPWSLSETFHLFFKSWEISLICYEVSIQIRFFPFTSMNSSQFKHLSTNDRVSTYILYGVTCCSFQWVLFSKQWGLGPVYLLSWSHTAPKVFPFQCTRDSFGKQPCNGLWQE